MLEPADSGGIRFLSWSEDCTGIGACQVTVDRSRSVTATFDTPIRWIAPAGFMSAVAVTSDAIYATGSVSNPTAFASGRLAITSRIDFFVARYGVDGRLVWVKNYGGVRDEAYDGLNVRVAPNGDVVTLGDLATRIDIERALSSNPGMADHFIARFSPAGGIAWASYINDGYSFDLDPRANPVVGTWNDAGLHRFDGAGKSVVVPMTTGMGDFEELAVDRAGNVYVCVTLSSGSVIERPGFPAVTGQGSWDLVLLKMSEQGQLSWMHHLPGTEGKVSRCSDVVVDPSGNFYVAAAFQGTIQTKTIGRRTSVGDGSQNDIYLAKVATSGQVLWEKTFGLNVAEDVPTIALGLQGDLLVGLGFDVDPFDIGGHLVTGDQVVRFSPGGEYRASLLLPGLFFVDIAVHPSGDLIVADSGAVLRTAPP